MATTVVIQQAAKMSNWDTGLFDCFGDMNTCCAAFWCCPCFACNTSGRFGENHCLPLMDILSPAITSAFGIPLFVPPAALSLRVAIRNTYGIKGSLCNDILTSCFCVCCTWCQMARELKKRKNAPTIINVQAQAAKTSHVQMVSQPNYVVPPGPTAMGPQPGYGSPPLNAMGYGVQPPAGYTAHPQGPAVYH